MECRGIAIRQEKVCIEQLDGNSAEALRV